MFEICCPGDKLKERLIQRLLDNDHITSYELSLLSNRVNADDLSVIIQHIYDLNETDILALAAVTGETAVFDDAKNDRRNRLFTKKIKRGFGTGKDDKVILVEGDSWYNYPVILTDVIDALSMDNRHAVYSLAKGGGWLLSMLTARKYIEQLSVLHPDLFIISGGGNDIVGDWRLAAVLQQPDKGQQLENCPWAQGLKENAKIIDNQFDSEAFDTGVQYLSKDFYALLMFFHLQYFMVMDGILNGGETKVSKFPGIQIITQGYDYPIPSISKNFGFDPLHWYVPFIRLLLGHGTWLKIPMTIRKIPSEIQRKIVYAAIFFFNEMVIDIGRCFNTDKEKRVLHIDSRNSLGEHGWTDELHARPRHFIQTGKVMSFAIHDVGNQHSTYDHVYVVHKYKDK